MNKLHDMELTIAKIIYENIPINVPEGHDDSEIAINPEDCTENEVQAYKYMIDEIVALVFDKAQDCIVEHINKLTSSDL